MSTPVPFFQHDLGEIELEAIRKVFAGTILTTGEQVATFEAQFADYLGRKYCVGLSHCTGAMHLSLLALGIGPGDEVITSPATFIATATAIISAGAKPVFVDVETQTGLLDPNRVESAITSKTKAILPIHLYGLMADMKALRQIADKHGLALLEDAAHCIEGMREGVRPGQLSATASFSFFATKNITCGEGGAVVTDDETLYRRIRLMRNHGMDKTSSDRFRDGYQHWDMPLFGWKYNMDNIQAAMLLPQLKRMESNLARRQKLTEKYHRRLEGVKGVRFVADVPNTRHARHLFTVWVDPKIRDEVIHQLGQKKISAMVNYRAIHLLRYFSDTLGHRQGDFPNAEWIGDATISLPLYPRMPEDHVDTVCDALTEIVAKLG